LLLKFVTLIAPGGSESGDTRTKVRDIFQERCGQANWEKMLAIEREFDAWKKAGDLDAGKTIAIILKHLGRFERTWVATGMNFPDDGHFVSEPFSLQELTDHIARITGV